LVLLYEYITIHGHLNVKHIGAFTIKALKNVRFTNRRI